MRMISRKRQEAESIIRAQKYANLMLDWTFKKVFGQQKNKDLLLSLINSILPGLDIKDVEYCTTELEGIVAENKTFVLDLRCHTEDKGDIIVEVQNYPHKAFFERCVSYGAYAYSTELHKGNLYSELLPVYVIAIISEEAADGMRLHEEKYDNRVVYNYVFREKETGEIANQSIMITFVELNKFTKSAQECEDVMDKWFYCFKNMSRLNHLPSSFQVEVFSKLFKEVNVATFNKAESDLYFREALAAFDKRMHEEFFVDKGREEGRAESQMEIARSFKVKGIDVKTIAECTGLTIEQVELL